MFGYVTVNAPELKVREYEKYKAYYCGLCDVLKERYGFVGQLTLTYDMTFLIILLTSLYEEPLNMKQHRCKVHPVKKKNFVYNKFTEYAADMNMILTYHHLMDDWTDEKSKVGFIGATAFRPIYKKLKKRYPKQCKSIGYWLHRLHELEADNETRIDRVSGCFGKLMESLIVYQDDVWSPTLKRLGFYLGKFIYIMDAYDDVEKDIKSNAYNPLKPLADHISFTEKCAFWLNMMMAECTIEFEKLPCVEDVEILRNILYAGVWKKFDKKAGIIDDHRSL